MQNTLNRQLPFDISRDDLTWCQNHNVKITWPGCLDYPAALMNLSYRPAFLFYLGYPIWLSNPLMSVVGSRSPTSASLDWLDVTLGDIIRRTRLAIVSGGAFGIDQKAHQIALRNETPTCVFLPSGLRNVYPSRLDVWIEPIVSAGGCVVSQFMPSQSMYKSYFRERNRLIAAISPLTLVVECRRRSGTLLTANYCLEFDKKLAVMPTFPGESGLGGLDFICNGTGYAVRDADDILLLYGRSLYET